LLSFTSGVLPMVSNIFFAYFIEKINFEKIENRI
jgi:hypothetical protein